MEFDPTTNANSTVEEQQVDNRTPEQLLASSRLNLEKARELASTVLNLYE